MRCIVGSWKQSIPNGIVRLWKGNQHRRSWRAHSLNKYKHNESKDLARPKRFETVQNKQTSRDLFLE